MDERERKEKGVGVGATTNEAVSYVKVTSKRRSRLTVLACPSGSSRAADRRGHTGAHTHTCEAGGSIGAFTSLFFVRSFVRSTVMQLSTLYTLPLFPLSNINPADISPERVRVRAPERPHCQPASSLRPMAASLEA